MSTWHKCTKSVQRLPEGYRGLQMAPTSLQDPEKALRQLASELWSIDQALCEREWFPLWLAGPVVALVAMLGLIGIAMLLAEVYRRAF